MPNNKAEGCGVLLHFSSLMNDHRASAKHITTEMIPTAIPTTAPVLR